MKNKKSEIAMIVILTVISVLFIAPIIIVFMLVQKQFVEGLASGAVKG